MPSYRKTTPGVYVLNHELLYTLLDDWGSITDSRREFFYSHRIQMGSEINLSSCITFNVKMAEVKLAI
jgi:hypothetical protein